MSVTTTKPPKVSYARSGPRSPLTERDGRRRDMAGFARKCGPLLKHLSQATKNGQTGGMEISYWSKMTHQENPEGLIRNLADLIHDLTTNPMTSASPLILGCLLAMQDALEDLPTEEIERRLFKALMDETPAEGEENNTTMRVMECRAQINGPAATPRDFEAYHRALEAQEVAMAKEWAIALDAIVLNRELRRRVGEGR